MGNINYCCTACVQTLLINSARVDSFKHLRIKKEKAEHNVPWAVSCMVLFLRNSGRRPAEAILFLK